MSEHEHELARRDFLRATGAGISALALGTGAISQAPGEADDHGLILRERAPENMESPFASLESFLTPNDKFYIRSHFAQARLDKAMWKLAVSGKVSRPLVLTYDDIVAMPSRTVPITLECAGNSRVYLAPTAKGVLWQHGAVSTAEWTGVPLSAVLERAGVLRGAVDVVLAGADTGELKDPPKPTGPIHFARSVPLSKARQGEILLAYKMNGEPLTQAHGFPLRVIVPGWYGMAAVKWLSRIVVTDTPFQGHFQTIDYARWERIDGIPTRVPLGEVAVKSEIARPAMYERIAPGSRYRIHGAAWTGDSEIARVDVSTDGGKSWNPAKMLGNTVKHAWRLWENSWDVPAQPGRVTLMARATDSRGATQPMEREPDLEAYMIHHVLPVEVEVR
jgi:DMSO/TMAO reductase YedYZ molybdopterin-dependent catalytic subunit